MRVIRSRQIFAQLTVTNPCIVVLATVKPSLANYLLFTFNLHSIHAMYSGQHYSCETGIVWQNKVQKWEKFVREAPNLFEVNQNKR